VQGPPNVTARNVGQTSECGVPWSRAKPSRASGVLEVNPMFNRHP